MKVKTSELIGPPLDWAVAKCERSGVTGVDGQGTLRVVGGARFSPSTDEALGGPIIDRERLATLPPIVKRISKERFAFPIDYWRAIRQDEDDSAAHGLGPTRLIAAMRCHVALKLGDKVEIPDELMPAK